MLACFWLAAPSSAAPLTWDANTQGQFITSLCRDNSGHVWIGTEDQGVWRCDPAAPKDKQYTHYTTQSTNNGLGDDNAYALTCDKAGRVWVGTLNHGVSVFNGKAWRTYGPVDGPLGSRIFALAVSPKDGGVWGATEAGLFRYQNSRWTYFTRANGLPSDQAQALAFGADGTLYVGTQCDGVAVGSPDDNYKTWRVTPGPAALPNTAAGRGLPSSLINCLLVTADNTVFAGTTTGLAKSRDGGETWTFVRGLDWTAKLAGLYHPVAPASSAYTGDLLTEDYVTSLAEDEQGRLFVGHRQTGVEAFAAKTGKRLQSGASGAKTDAYAFCLLLSGKSAWVGQYGGGLLPPADMTADADAAPSTVASLPAPAAPPTLADLNKMLKVVSAVVPDKNELQPKLFALQDDWLTQGDWLGRYGRYWACLNAICSPQDYLWGAGWETVHYSARIGPHAASDDGLRYWVQWLYTKDPRVLEMPPTYLDSRVQKKLTTPDNNRREAEWDDHGEAYLQSREGPNVYATISIPNGLFYLSLYEVNYNGHDLNSVRYRDYRLSLRAHTASSLDNVSQFGSQLELAQGRVHNFWGGVWKRFLVRGPLTVTIEVNRNHSFNTILPAVMLDLVNELPPPYFGSIYSWHQSALRLNPLPVSLGPDPAARLLSALDVVQMINSSWWAAHSRLNHLILLRWYNSQPVRNHNTTYLRSLASCYYGINLYKHWEDCLHVEGLTPARDIEHALKWDGSYDLRGQDGRIATEYVIQHPELNKQLVQQPSQVSYAK